MNVWEITILKSIESRGGQADTSEIYSDIESGKFITLSREHLRETKYEGRPAYQHQVRSHLSNLLDSKEIVRSARGRYLITSRGLERIGK